MLFQANDGAGMILYWLNNVKTGKNCGRFAVFVV